MRAAFVAAAALLAACGSSAERRRFDAFRDACDGLVASGATLQDASARFGQGASAIDCAAPIQPLAGGVDQCNYAAPVCRVFFLSYAYDTSLCNPLGGCYYWCEVRVPATAVPPPDTAVVCGAWFVSGQPCPLRC